MCLQMCRELLSHLLAGREAAGGALFLPRGAAAHGAKGPGRAARRPRPLALRGLRAAGGGPALRCAAVELHPLGGVGFREGKEEDAMT